MLKLLRIRSWIGLIAVSAIAAGLFAMQDRLAGWWTAGSSWRAVGQEEGDWRQQELSFLKAIYDRLERQRRAEGGDAPASLRREQEAILRRIAETAKPIRDKVPAEIGALLPDPPASAAEKPEPREAPVAAAATPAAAPVAAVAAPPAPMPAPAAPPGLPEVRIEPTSLPRIEVDLGPLSRPLEFDRPAERIVKLREPRPAKPAEAKAKEAKSGEAKSAETKPAEAKTGEPKPEAKSAEAKAGEAKSEAKPAKPKAAKPKPAVAAPETSGSAKE